MSIVTTTLRQGAMLLALLGCLGGVKAADKAPVDGVRLTISGPAFAGPQTFVIPGDFKRQFKTIDKHRFMLQLNPGANLWTANGQHRLDGFMLGTQPGKVGTFTETAGVSTLWLSFTIDANTHRSQGASMDFEDKGAHQPVTIVIESFEDEARAKGHFTARVQRTNHKSQAQFYDLKGVFDIRIP